VFLSSNSKIAQVSQRGPKESPHSSLVQLLRLLSSPAVSLEQSPGRRKTGERLREDYK